MKRSRSFQTPGGTDGAHVKVTFNTDGCEPGKPYFSLTGAHYSAARESDRNMLSCGCIHEKIIEVCHEMAPLVAIHLSTLDGVPMHATENAVHWVSGALPDLPGFQYRPTAASSYGEHTPESCVRILGEHLRTDPLPVIEAVLLDVAPVLALHARRLATVGDIEKVVRTTVGRIVETLRPQWKREAEEALALAEKLFPAGGDK